MKYQRRACNPRQLQPVIFSSIFLAFLLTWLLIPISARAQEEHVQETITVTAQKHEEDVQDVPMSISVLNTQHIEDLNIESISELSDFVPNLTMFNNGAPGFDTPSIRGLHAFLDSGTVSTGLFVDGVPILAVAGFEDTFLDIERVEVLRGPQGTLYGKNTEAGVINIITRQPNNEFRGKVAGEYGEDNKQKVNFNLAGPIMQDTLFFSLAGQHYSKDGYIENILTGETANDRENWYGKGSLRWTPTEDLDISLLFSGITYNNAAQDMSLSKAYAAMFGIPDPSTRQIMANHQGYTDAESHTQSLKINYDITDTLKLTSITSNRTFDNDNHYDWDFSSMTYQHSKDKSNYNKISQELRLDNAGKRLNWLVGLYYDKDDNDTLVDLDSGAGFSPYNDSNTQGEAYALFGQARYALFEKLGFTAGLRYEKQDMEFTDNRTGSFLEESWSALSPKVALDYAITSDTNTYASVTKGYRSGGFNAYANDPAYTSYDEENLWSYEVGVKTHALNNRLTVNAAVFYMNISDMQVNEAISATETYITNAAEASGYGGEIEVVGTPMDGVTINAGIGYANLEFDQHRDLTGDYSGNKISYSPEYTYNLGAQYRSPAGFYLRCDLIGVGKTYLDSSNDASRDAYEIVNAKIGWEWETFDIYLYGKNLFDEEYNSYDYAGGYYTVYSDPRELGATVVYRF
jgi:iron complex outermembrane receptor protein